MARCYGAVRRGRDKFENKVGENSSDEMINRSKNTLIVAYAKPLTVVPYHPLASKKERLLG